MGGVQQLPPEFEAMATTKAPKLGVDKIEGGSEIGLPRLALSSAAP